MARIVWWIRNGDGDTKICQCSISVFAEHVNIAVAIATTTAQFCISFDQMFGRENVLEK